MANPKMSPFSGNDSSIIELFNLLKVGPQESGKPEEWLKILRREVVEKPVIFIGTGTCGLGAGAGKTLNRVYEYLKEKQIEADVVEVGCIGLCVEEPIVEVQLPGKTRVAFRKMTVENIDSIFDSIFSNTIPLDNVIGQHRAEGLESWENIIMIDEHPFFAPQTRWVLANCGLVDPVNIDEYIAHGGFRALSKVVSSYTREEICNILVESGLRGRGGGGFLTGMKWKFALNTEADQKYFICNADEGDPGAFMDRAVIEGDPFRLVEGLAIAAYAIGANKAYVYIRAEYPLAIKRLKEAIRKSIEYGLLGKNILDSGFDLQIIIKMGAGAFVCGE